MERLKTTKSVRTAPGKQPRTGAVVGAEQEVTAPYELGEPGVDPTAETSFGRHPALRFQSLNQSPRFFAFSGFRFDLGSPSFAQIQEGFYLSVVQGLPFFLERGGICCGHFSLSPGAVVGTWVPVTSYVRPLALPPATFA